MPLPRSIEGSLDPWTVEDDCITMQSDIVSDDREAKLFSEDPMMRSGVNFINFLRAAFMRPDPKDTKKLSSCQSFLRFRDLWA